MGLAWNGIGMLGLAAGALALGLAWAVARAPGPSRANRRLALVLAVEGLATLCGTGLLYLVDDKPTALSLQRAATGLSLLLPSCYLALLGTLDARIVAPLRGRGGLVVAVGLGVLLEVGLLLDPSLYVLDVAPTWYAAQEAVPGALAWVPASLLLLVSLYGLAAALLARKEAPPATMRRVRAQAYAWAFGVRDLTLVLVLLLPLVGHAVAPSRVWDLFPVLGFPAALLLYVPTLAYGILRTQLFDIDLRLKGGAQRGVVLAVFLAVYVGVSQAAMLVAGPQVGTLVGILSAAALAFVVRPLDRSASRVVDRVMPLVRDEEAYLARRRLEVYRAALEENAERPGSSARLGELRERLGVTASEDQLLRELVERAGSSASASGAAGRAASRAPLVGERYAPLAPLGEGGGGTTMLARDELLGREVAIKRVHGDVKAALAEARTLALVHDPHIVTVHDTVRDREGAWIVMEHVAGGTLAQRIAAGPLGVDEFARVARGILRGLDAAHAVGILHRDVKPANVLLTPRGDAKLADLGLAGGLPRAAAASARYASPEQRAGAATSVASDIWSAAATLREAMPAQLADALAPWMARAMAETPGDRFGTAREALVALEGALSPPRTPGANARRQ